MSLDLQVKGVAELARTLRGMSKEIHDRALRGAVATAAAVFRVEAVARAPYYTGRIQEGHPPAGTLQRAIYQSRLVSQCTETREVWRVSVHKGNSAAKSGKDAYYASFVEFGHYTRGPSARTAQQRKGMSSGESVPLGTYYIQAQPFMRPAFEVKKQQAADAMRDYLADRVQQIWKEAA